MKFTTINLGETQIELYKSFLGKETVKVNGNILASEWTFSGTVHEFTVNENGKEVHYKLKTGTGIMGLMFGLKRDEVPVIEFPKSKGWGTFLFVVVLLIILAYLVGDLFRSLQAS
jgi:hypothetical protein